MLIPEGTLLTKLKVRLLAGRSESLPETVTARGLPSSTDRSLRGANTGALLPSVTVTVKVWAPDSGGEPLSVTRTGMVTVAGPCASVGVHVNTPVAGLMLAPDGAPASRLKASVFAGASASVAVKVRVSVLPSVTV